MSYLSFLLIFVGGPAFILSLTAWWRFRTNNQTSLLIWHCLGTLILAVVAFTWTTPWDNYIVARGVWSYDATRVIGTVGYVPLEEYLFFILMPILNSAFFALTFLKTDIYRANFQTKQTLPRIFVSILTLIVVIVATRLSSIDSFTYLATTLIWFTPPLWIQWVFDPTLLRKALLAVLTTTLVPAIYLSSADALAIHQGIWTIHPKTRTGWEIGNLPFEEAFFFFITSLLLAQGLALWHSLRRP